MLAPLLLIRAARLNGFAARRMVARFATAADRRYATTFRRRQRQQQSLLARALLRSALASVGASWRREIDTAGGRPRLFDTRWQASIAHSRDLVVVALARRCAIGIDVEFIKLDRDIATVARGMDWPATGPAAFYRRWTEAEAYFKASGRHLAGSLAGGWRVATRTLDGRYVLAAAWHPGPGAPPGAAQLLRSALGQAARQAAPMPRW